MFCQLSESMNVNQNRVEPYTGVCIITFANPKRLSTLRIIDSQNKPTSSALKLISIHTSHLAASNTKKGFKGEALCLLRTNSVEENFYKYKRDFEQRLCNRGDPAALVHKILTEVQSPT